MPRRHHILDDSGTLLVSTDVHGCLADFQRMRAIFEQARDDNEYTHWVILGDIVHGPDEGARARRPELYDYDDESGTIAREILELQTEHPDHVHFVLGNHDWAHVGGPAVRKFYDDEAAYLESQMSDDEVESLHELLYDSLLCVVAPCGAFLSHASPSALFASFDELDEIDLRRPLTDRQKALVTDMTNYYGQREPVTRSFLRHVSELSGHDLRFVVHGHDRDEEGWFAHEATQVCVVIFGAPRANKRYLRLDLSARYDSVESLREGYEVLRLWNDPAPEDQPQDEDE